MSEELAALQLRLQLAEAQERTSRVQLEIEQARVVQQQKRHKANLSALPLEDAHARVRQLQEVRSKETELAIKDRKLELASREAVLAGLYPCSVAPRSNAKHRVSDPMFLCFKTMQVVCGEGRS